VQNYTKLLDSNSEFSVAEFCDEILRNAVVIKVYALMIEYCSFQHGIKGS